MHLPITTQDRKKSKVTCIILSVLIAIFTALSIVFGTLIPQTTVQKSLQTNGEEILALMDGKDGTEYFLASDSRIERHDAFTDDLISVFEFSTIRETMDKKGIALRDGSLLTCNLSYLSGLSEDYFVLYDINGNFFKLKDDGVNLTLTDDYYISQKKTVIKGMDNIGEDVYVLANKSDASNYVQKWNALNFAGGCVAERKLWYADKSAGADATVIKGLYGNDISVYQFTATQDSLLLMRSGGNIIRIGLDFVDSYDENGNAIDFFGAATAYYETQYTAAYNESYRLFFVDLVLGLEQTVRTPDDIRNATTEDLIAWYGDRENGGKSQTTVERKKGEAADYAKAQAVKGFTEQNDWAVAYDKDKGEVTVKNSAFNAAAYAIIEPGTSVAGLVYSPKNQAFYYANASDGYLYSVDKADFDNAEFPGSFLSDLGKKVEGISYTKKKVNDSVGNGLGYNKFANTIYVKFRNERTVDIVDINDKDNCKVLYSFEGDFNIYSLTGDKDNKTTHALRQVGIVRLDGSENTVYYACTYDPNLFEQKTLIKTVFIVALVLAIVCAALCVWFAITLKNDRLMAKTKIIQRDLLKNKWIYASLIIFIALLILFCYYEAIGAIAMSFFDYTQEEPAWIWNNFGNYLKIFNEDKFFTWVGNMLFFLVTDLFFCIVPPLIFAFLLSHIRYEKVSSWVRSLMFIPGIIPSIATMLIWREGIYGTDGVFNQILGVFGVEPIRWLLDADLSRWSLILMGFPFVGGYLIFYGGMMNIPKEYHEAGRLEGLSVVKEFLTIDIPLIMPQIKYIFIMTFIDSAQNYARTHILSATGSDTVVHIMYREMSLQGNYGLSSAYATLIFVFLFAAVATNFKMQKKDAMGDDL